MSLKGAKGRRVPGVFPGAAVPMEPYTLLLSVVVVPFTHAHSLLCARAIGQITIEAMKAIARNMLQSPRRNIWTLRDGGRGAMQIL